MTRAGVLLLTFVLVASPAFAQDGLLVQAERATNSLALQQAPARGGMHPGFLWTGISLLGVGGLYMAIGATGDDICQGTTCLSSGAIVGFGVAVAGAGAALLLIGNAKRPPMSPDVTFLPGGVRLGKTISF